MKLIIVLAVVAWSNAAKLDRTYLPPNAQASAGSGSFLQTPLSGPSSDYQTQAGFSRNRPAQRFPQSQQGFSQPQSGFSQPQSGFSQSQNVFSQPQSGLSQPQHGFEQSQNGFAQPQAYGQNQNGFENFESHPERPQAAFERNAAILRQDSQNDGETYSYAYETENGIYAEESGVASNGVEAQGGFSYTGDDGKVYSIRYTADQNGFIPQGDHLPTPPPIPEEILKALEQNARDEAAGIYDDGSYSEGKYSNDDSNQYGNGNNANNYNNGNNNYNNGNNAYNNGNNAYNNDNNAYNNDDDTIVTNSAAFRGAPDSGNFASQGAAGATKAYLPPLQNQRNGPSGRNAGRRPSFNARDGYRY